ncbi:MAG: hypothetical protein NTZ41_01725 [Sphingobacteriales bacterium]|jgi:hypothetical protein|nr:hypothetical protein [Sphingobacteriales bacterium]
MKIIIFSFLLTASVSCLAQDFTKDMATAKSAYNSGKLEESHFALLQAMQELDLIVGKEVLQLLPQKMDTLMYNVKDDNVSGTIGYVGTSMHRSYGKGDRKADLTIISNSPMIGMVNALLNNPMMGGLSNDGKSKTVKVQGYKGRLERKDTEKPDVYDYELQIPLGNALITFLVEQCTDKQALALAETIPLQQIAKLIL